MFRNTFGIAAPAGRDPDIESEIRLGCRRTSFFSHLRAFALLAGPIIDKKRRTIPRGRISKSNKKVIRHICFNLNDQGAKLRIIKTVFEDKKNITMPIGSILIFMFMITIFWGMGSAETLTEARIQQLIGERIAESNIVDLSKLEKLPGEPLTEDGRANEGGETPMKVSVDDTNVCEISFTLSWSDEADADGRHTNEPDSFTIRVESPDGSYSSEDTGQNSHGGKGNIELSLTLFDESNPPKSLPFLNGTGDWNIIISVAAGDQEPLIPSPFGMRTYSDTGNDFTLATSYSYTE